MPIINVGGIDTKEIKTFRKSNLNSPPTARFCYISTKNHPVGRSETKYSW